MIYAAKDALLAGSGVSDRIAIAYEQLAQRLAQAVDAEDVSIVLAILQDKPVEHSDGEYFYLRGANTLIIRVNGQLDSAERVRVFFRELAEFLQICERGYALKQEIWEHYAPLEYNKIKEALSVQAW
ncbi:MAG: hypothetical protein NZM28_10460 [Fimbriimonadales bacterium]|nr:hypothetical protein [Fimbriimonadales bacterium]